METNNTSKLSRKTLRAIATYGRDNCELAYHMNENIGEGANTISHVVLGGKWAGKTRSADAAIDAGREMFHTQ
jgi:hypothetical protein